MNQTETAPTPENPTQSAKLKRAIGLPMLVLYGLGTTIGAGIYVLVGETAGRAGEFAPISFAISALVMAFSAASFAEFSGRVPQSAGEAVYVEEGFRKPWLAALTGYAIILAGTVAAAAISLGCAGYVAQLLPVPEPVIVLALFTIMGLLAIWGIQESVTVASVLTVIEVIGLLVIIGAGFRENPAMLSDVPTLVPEYSNTTAWTGVISASLIAFFAFIGFDDVVNVVEETVNPARVMPWAIGITLLVVTVLYIMVSIVAVDTLPLEELSVSKAPIGLLFERLTGISPLTITLVAIAATMNGIVIQIIMASRVAYGLSRRHYLPQMFSAVNPLTQTPIYATVLIAMSGLVFALFVPLGRLAEFTSQLILFIFCLVNVSLVIIKFRGDDPPEGIFTVPNWIPVVGAISCFALLAGPFFIS
ncbi:MAG: APC family permease [Rhizobiaceae bacterium]